MTKRSGVSRVASVLLLASLLPSTASAVDFQPLDQCAQDLEGSYYLTADLDCSGGEGVGFASARAQLELRGFSIRNSSYAAVLCTKSCSVTGPGVLEDSGVGIRASGKVVVEDVTIRGMEWVGIETLNHRDSTRVEVRGSEIEGGILGIRAQSRVTLEDSTVTGASDSGIMVGGAVKWRTGAGLLERGLHCGRGRVELLNSSVVGNSIAPNPLSCDETHPCTDIVSCFVPELDETSACETSGKYRDGGTHGACSLD
jgi:hypothetical protein